MWRRIFRLWKDIMFALHNKYPERPLLGYIMINVCEGGFVMQWSWNENAISYFFLLLLVKSIGCYRDTGRRAIPQMDGRNPLVTGFYRRRADAILKCALVAMRFGYRAFAVQHQGWCATGPRAHVTYRKYGRSNRCRNGKGGPWANDVYTIHGKCYEMSAFIKHP